MFKRLYLHFIFGCLSGHDLEHKFFTFAKLNVQGSKFGKSLQKSDYFLYATKAVTLDFPTYEQSWDRFFSLYVLTGLWFFVNIEILKRRKKREKLKMHYHWSRQPPIKESLWHFTNTTSNIDDISDNLLRQVMLCAPLPALGLKWRTFADIYLMWRYFFVKMTANSEVGWMSARGYGSFFSGKIPK